MVTDWEAINKLPGDYAKQVETSINAGIDMVMVPTNFRDFIATMKELVAAGRIPIARVDDAVRRILRQKARFGLWEHPFADRRLTAAIGSAPHRAVARQAVRESLVLLKNDRHLLPLSKGARINVAGSKADDIGAQCGGWTVGWQGKRGRTTDGHDAARGDPPRGRLGGDDHVLGRRRRPRRPRAPTSTSSSSARSPTPRGAAIAPSPS